MFKSIRWRFIVIFFMLVLIVIVISGVYIIQFFEQYSYDLVNSRLDALSELMLPDLEVHKDLKQSAQEVSQIVNNSRALGFREEVYVIVNNQILATTANSASYLAADSLQDDLVLTGLSGESSRAIVTMPIESDQFEVMDKVYPIVSEQLTRGVLYLRYDLRDTTETINRARTIILQSTVIALSITMVLGYIIAKNVTDPINDITKQAYLMASGDFDQHVTVRSDDEIGKLAEMFNHLTKRLKRSLQDITREKSKFEAIVNNIDDGLIAMNSEKRVIHINQRAIKLLTDHNVVLSDYYNDIAEQLPPEFELNYINRHYPQWRGSEIIEFDEEIYRVRYEPFISEGTNRTGLIIVLQDVTESQRLESMRRQFVANVSHELKTPITSIKSYAETLMDGAVAQPEIAQNFLAVINAEADRMNRLVKDLLQLSNFDAKRILLDIEDNNWQDLIDASCQKMAMLINQHGHHMTMSLADEPLISQFDYHRMEQVVINLLSNAVKYTADGGEIAIELRDLGADVKLAITDSGVGIASEHLPHLFERFYRVDKGRSRDLGGTGLGLAIAKEIIELHGGTIVVNSALGKGTTVSLTLPKSQSLSEV